MNKLDFAAYVGKRYPLIMAVNQQQEYLRCFSETQISELCRELRDFITEQVALHGGHLASNLGVVELTVALLRTFDFSRDRLIWDVGHQSYAWKILTGRALDFANLREKNGLSGFPKPQESPYDHFATGHATTSISAALGMAAALKLKHSDAKVIAVIGDGALTGGMAWEALNNIATLEPNLLIILNDNAMSIDKNVGFVAKELSRLRLSGKYLNLKQRLKTSLQNKGKIGRALLRCGKSLKAFLRSKLGQQREFFCERYGCRYYGPTDGHDYHLLESNLQALKTLKQAALFHVLTEKGHGLELAVKDPVTYHGVKAHDYRLQNELGLPTPLLKAKKVEFGQDSLKPLPFTAIFSQTIMEAATEADFVCITAAMAQGTGLNDFAAQYPQRFYDVGIAEQHAVCYGAGLVSQGIKTVCAIYDTFLQRALDAVVHDVCLQKLPLILAIDRAGLVGEDGATHQGIYSLPFLASLPNLDIINVSQPHILKAFLTAALRNESERALALRYYRGVCRLPAAFYEDMRVEDYSLTGTTTAVYTFTPINNGIGFEVQDYAIQDCKLPENGKELQADLVELSCDYVHLLLSSFDIEAAAPVIKEGAVVVLTSSRLTATAIEAVWRRLHTQGIKQTVTVVDCFNYSRCIRDMQIPASALQRILAAAGKIIILEESCGASPLASVCHYNCPLLLRNLPLKVIEQGKVEELLADYGLDSESIARELQV